MPARGNSGCAVTAATCLVLGLAAQLLEESITVERLGHGGRGARARVRRESGATRECTELLGLAQEGRQTSYSE